MLKAKILIELQIYSAIIYTEKAEDFGIYRIYIVTESGKL